MITPSIGAMRYRLNLEAPARTADGGGASETWQPVADVWAAIDPTSGDEAIGSEAIRGRITHTIHIRYRSGVVPAMRLRLGTRCFDILGLIDVGERHRRLRCLCRERDL
ncbi:MAG: phage head closure protein [Hyphomicrobiaceae bacterium]